jgi:hypothetical protein
LAERVVICLFWLFAAALALSEARLVWIKPTPRTTANNIQGPAPCGNPAAVKVSCLSKRCAAADLLRAKRTTSETPLSSICLVVVRDQKPTVANSYFTDQPYIFTYQVAQAFGGASAINRTRTRLIRRLIVPSLIASCVPAVTMFGAPNTANVTGFYAFPQNSSLVSECRPTREARACTVLLLIPLAFAETVGTQTMSIQFGESLACSPCSLSLQYFVSRVQSMTPVLVVLP